MVLYIELKREKELRLREKAMKRFGYTKGALKEAVEEAVDHWLASKADIHPEPLAALRGMLRGVKMSSVELKHRATELFAK